MKKVVLVTGASSGIGKAIATELARKGMIVYGTSRDSQKISESFPFRLITVDITDTTSVSQGIQNIIEKEGRIDAVINNAGTGFNGPVEDVSNEEAIVNYSLNVLGAWNVCRAVIPTMRSQGGGNIISISSIAGLMGLPFRGLYCSSKHALEGLMESLSMEVLRWNIFISIVEPAEFNTPIIRNRGSAAKVSPVYKNEFEKIVQMVNEGVASAPEPAVVGKCIAKILRSSKPRLRYKIAPFATKMSIVLKRMLPDRLFERILMNHYGLKRERR